MCIPLLKLAARLTKLESALADMAERLQRLEAARATAGTIVPALRKDDESEYEVSSLIG